MNIENNNMNSDSAKSKNFSRKSNKKFVKSAAQEYITRLIKVNRVAKVVKGGTNFSFSALVSVGDGLGRVTLGLGKSRELSDAVRKASEKAKKDLNVNRNHKTRFPLKYKRTIHHDVWGKFGASKIFLRYAPEGTGLICGEVPRAIFESLGIKDINAKLVGNNNPINVAKAVINALSSIQTPRYIRRKKGLDFNVTSSEDENVENTSQSDDSESESSQDNSKDE